MIFQRPRGVAQPALPGRDDAEQVLRTHRGLRGAAARQVAVDLLADVGLPDPRRVLRAVPARAVGRHGQRVMIAWRSLGAEPAGRRRANHGARRDGPAADHQLLARLRAEHGLALILITHNLSVVAELCDRVARHVPRRIVEEGPVLEISTGRGTVHDRRSRRSRPSAHMDGASR